MAKFEILNPPPLCTGKSQSSRDLRGGNWLHKLALYNIAFAVILQRGALLSLSDQLQTNEKAESSNYSTGGAPRGLVKKSESQPHSYFLMGLRLFHLSGRREGGAVFVAWGERVPKPWRGSVGRGSASMAAVSAS